jgi:ATP-dependent HslUV protease ATP-binding subunit HslU
VAEAAVEEELRDEIAPNNLILIGPTGVGKTEIARRLARLAGAPFVKVEASKFTEVGYVGRDVESMVRDLADTAVNLVRAEREDEVQEVAEARAEERLLDLLFPAGDQGGSGGVQVRRRRAGPPAPGRSQTTRRPPSHLRGGLRGRAPHERRGAGRAGRGRSGRGGSGDGDELTVEERRHRTREKLRKLLRDGNLEDREVEIEVDQTPNIEGMMIPMGMEGMDPNFTEMLQEMLPRGRSGARSPWARPGACWCRRSSTDWWTWTRS